MTEKVTEKRRRTVTGKVTSAKTDKTRRVEIPRLVKHPRYSKFIRRRTVCHVHDEKNLSQLGDTVEIMECRPMSKTKNWLLLRVVSKAPTGLAAEETKAAAPETGATAGAGS